MLLVVSRSFERFLNPNLNHLHLSVISSIRSGVCLALSSSSLSSLLKIIISTPTESSGEGSNDLPRALDAIFYNAHALRKKIWQSNKQVRLLIIR